MPLSAFFDAKGNQCPGPRRAVVAGGGALPLDTVGFDTVDKEVVIAGTGLLLDGLLLDGLLLDGLLRLTSDDSIAAFDESLGPFVDPLPAFDESLGPLVDPLTTFDKSFAPFDESLPAFDESLACFDWSLVSSNELRVACCALPVELVTVEGIASAVSGAEGFLSTEFSTVFAELVFV
jgi:hypothetical protein